MASEGRRVLLSGRILAFFLILLAVNLWQFYQDNVLSDTGALPRKEVIPLYIKMGMTF